jgi:hypothetical protein
LCGQFLPSFLTAPLLLVSQNWELSCIGTWGEAELHYTWSLGLMLPIFEFDWLKTRKNLADHKHHQRSKALEQTSSDVQNKGKKERRRTHCERWF